MIKLINVNKYFNKNRNNQIHVINHTSIDFPEKGLVAITGPSGCGKTTLLNVIAGLDNFHSGEIIYEEKSVQKYKSSIIDQIRNEKIGFIFQNYNLLPDQTVYDNIKTSLNIAGLYDKEELDKRIHYALEKVGMFNYRKRNVLALSGGQQQRVGIARAVAKNPDVIFADEPTGNLDSNNTFEVMRLIKNISKDKLVIIVTHERDLVDFYADRIIELKDGQVMNDYQNFNSKGYNHKDDRFVYLKDLNNEDLKSQFIDYYYEKENNKHFNLKVVEMNNTIYVKASSEKKIVFIDDDSEVRLIDEHKKEIKVDEMEPLDFEQFKPIEFSHKKSLFRWRDTLLAGLKKLFSKKKFKKKLSVFVYFLISALIAGQLASLGNLIKIEDSAFMRAPYDYIGVGSDVELDADELSEIYGVEGVELPYQQYAYLSFFKQTFYQISANTEQSVWPVRAAWVDENDLLYGSMPTSPNEIVISTYTADRIMESYFVSRLNIKSPRDLIGFSALSQYGSTYQLEVVGIIDAEDQKVVYSDTGYDLTLLGMRQFMNLDVYGDDLEIESGRLPAADDEILVANASFYNLGDTVQFSTEYGASDVYEIVGLFSIKPSSDLSSPTYLVTAQAFDELNIYYQEADFVWETDTDFEYRYFAEDKAQAIEDLEALGFEAYDIYDLSREAYADQRALEFSSRIITLLVTLGGIVLYIYFVMKTSMINRVREIGIYRAIGATKRDLYKIFLSEILVYTTLVSAVGYFVSTYILMAIENQVNTFVSVFYMPFWLMMVGLIGIYIVNIIFGLFPIFNLMRKTPAQILAKYDI